MVWLYLCSFVLLSILQAFTHRHLLADGSSFLLEILESRWFVTWDFPRQHAQYLTQWPVVLAMRAFNVQSMRVLSALYGLSLFAIPWMTLLLCTWMIPRYQRHFLSFIVMVLAFLSINSSLFVISESHLGAGCFLVLVSYLIFARSPTLAQSVVAALVAVASTRIYEFFLFYGVVLCALVVWRLRSGNRSVERPWVLYTLFCTSIVAGGIAVASMLHSQAHPLARVGTTQIIARLSVNPMIVLSLFVLLWGLVAAYRRSTKFPSLFDIVSVVILGTCAGLLSSLGGECLPVTLHYDARLFNLILPTGLAVLFFVQREHTSFSPRLMLPLLLLVAWNITWQGNVSAQWNHYVQRVQNILRSEHHLVQNETTVIADDPFMWSWTLPSLSIVVSAFDGPCVDTLISAPRTTRWQPFLPQVLSEWPKLGHLGFYYRGHSQCPH